MNIADLFASLSPVRAVVDLWEKIGDMRERWKDFGVERNFKSERYKIDLKRISEENEIDMIRKKEEDRIELEKKKLELQKDHWEFQKKKSLSRRAKARKVKNRLLEREKDM